MFLGLDARRERGLIVVGAYLHHGLDDGRAAIEFLGDEVHGGAVHRIAGC
jgi:hypothetical protein